MLLFFSWVACSIFFSTSAISASFLAKYTMPLEFMIFYRLLIASAILIVIIFLRKERFTINKNEIFPSILVSISQLNVWLAAYGTKYLISGLVPCVSLMQIFVAELLSSLIEKRKMRRKIIISGCLGTVGIAMLCNQQFLGVGNASIINTIIGIFFAFIATFAAAGGNILYEKSEKTLIQMPHSTFLFYNCIFACLFLLLLGMIINPVEKLADRSIFDIKYFAVLLFLAITATVVALFALYYIIEKQGAVKATYMNFILPIISMAISTVVEGFRWNTVAIIGMIVLLYSVYIGVQEKEKQQHEKGKIRLHEKLSLLKRTVKKIFN